MALPVPNVKLAKKKLDPMDELVDARMQQAPAKSGAVPGAAGATYAVDQQAARDNVNAATDPIAADKVRRAKEAAKAAANAKGPLDPMDALVDARSAAAAELDVDKAKALQGASARAGAGGFGLSGGTSAMLSDISRQQDRNKILTMADFDKMMADQSFTDIQRRAATDDAEMAADFDYNDDGFIGGQKVGGKIGDRDIENDPATGTQKERESVDSLVANMPTDDYSWWDENAEPGSIQEPYAYPGSFEDLKSWYAANSPEALPLKMTRQDTGQPGQKAIVYTDKNGVSYVVTGMSSSGKPVATATGDY